MTIKSRKQQQKPKQRKLKAPKSVGQRKTLPSVIGQTVKGSAPKIIRNRDGSISVSHREIIHTFKMSPTGVTVRDLTGDTQIPLNPGLRDSFRWLSGLAVNYENYSFDSLHFEYQPVTGTGTEGGVFMALDYNARNPAPAEAVEYMDNENALQTSSWLPARLTASHHNLKKFKEMYHRYSDSSDEKLDLNVYDVGNLFLAHTVESSQERVFGFVYVSYVVRLFTPQTNTVPNSLTNSNTSVFNGQLSKPMSAVDLVLGDKSIGSLVEYYDQEQLGSGPITKLTGRMVFRDPGEYLVSFNNSIIDLSTAGSQTLSLLNLSTSGALKVFPGFVKLFQDVVPSQTALSASGYAWVVTKVPLAILGIAIAANNISPLGVDTVAHYNVARSALGRLSGLVTGPGTESLTISPENRLPRVMSFMPEERVQQGHAEQPATAAVRNAEVAPQMGSNYWPGNYLKP